MTKHLIVLALAVAGLHLPSQALATEFKSQLSGFFSLNDSSPATPRFGLRWQPAVSLALPLSGGWKLDGEAVLDAAGGGSAPGWRSTVLDGAVKPYRMWLRLSTQRFEARLGLQKINFGSAAVFRPLMWFDRVDVRDPLQLSAGIYGLLLRYYFKGDANLWLWGLYGNNGLKGRETLPTAARSPELGGRFQVPLFSGEVAATAHFRRTAQNNDAVGGRAGESRFALDGKWDVGVGLWVEAAFIRSSTLAAELPWRRSLAVGIDYTLGLGNGLYLLAEQFFSRAATSPFGGGRSEAALSALLARYPLGLLDSLSAIAFYDWRDRRLYALAGWQRVLDRWQFNVTAFCNPRQAPAAPAPTGSDAFAGRGLQLLAVWNI